MQDSTNLKKKIGIHYPKLIRKAESKGDVYSAAYWSRQLELVKEKLAKRIKNRKK